MSNNKKIRIGITGSIGSGKSTFCAALQDKGFPVINIDELSKSLLVEKEEIKKRIIKEFGQEAYVDNKLNKKYLAESVFADNDKVNLINSIVHPAVIREVAAQMASLLLQSDLVFAEAALIYEADMEDMFDYVVLVTAEEKIRMKRAKESGRFSEDEFLKRNSNQIPDSEKKKRADIIFENNGGASELKLKAGLLINILEGLKQ